MRAMHLAVAVFAASLFTQPYAQVTVSVNRDVRYQVIEGFGTCGMDVQPWKQRQGAVYVDVDLDSVGFHDTVISQLGATMLRIYSHGELEQTPGGIDNPSVLDPMYQNVRKFAAAAERQNEPLRFISTSWSPPAWMKVNGKVPCDFAQAPNCLTTECRLKADMEEHLADYFVRYVRLIKDSTDIDLYAFSIQNEPAYREPYASCVFCPLGYRELLRTTARRFRQEGMQTRFFGAEHGSGSFGHFERAIRADEEALSYVHAWAVHAYTDGIQADTGSYAGSSPTDKPLWMTETSHYGARLHDWPAAMLGGKVILSYLRDSKLSAWCWWALNLATTGPIENADCEYHVMINGQPTDKYYMTSHFSRYVRPGARQIQSSSNDDSVLVVAFYHEGNDCMSIVLLNRGPAKTVTGGIQGSNVPATFERVLTTDSVKIERSTVASNEDIVLPAQSITTLVAGAYRGTGPVDTTSVARTISRVQSTPAPAGAVRVEILTLDGRRVGFADPQSGRLSQQLPAGIYIRTFVDRHGRAVSARRLTVSGR